MQAKFKIKRYNVNYFVFHRTIKVTGLEQLKKRYFFLLRKGKKKTSFNLCMSKLAFIVNNNMSHFREQRLFHPQLFKRKQNFLS